MADVFKSSLTAPTVLDRLVGWVSPRAGLQRFNARQMLTRAYAAALPGDGWRPKRAGASANAEHAASASILRAKSRSLIENVDYIAAGMSARVAHIVGTGIVPTWRGRDGEALDRLWKRWVKVADADGVRDLYGIQAAAVRAMDADGEVMIRIRARLPSDGLPVPMQLQLIEVDRLDTSKSAASGSNTIIQGIEYDPLGRVVAYHIWNQHPGDIGPLRARGMQSTRVVAEEIIHLFNPGRPGQGRGFPRLSPVINRARDLQLLEDAELARKNLEGRLSVLASGDIAGMADGGQFGTPGDGKAPAGSLGELASGGITQIPAGMNLTVVEPKAAPGFVDYCKYNIHLVCSGAGFTYEQATGDMSEVNFSSARVRMLDFRREIEQMQWLTVVPMLCDRICQEFVAYAYLAGLLPARLDWTVEHTTPKWDYINPSQDIRADLDEIAGGLSSFSEKLRRRGYDPKVVFDELESDIKDLQSRGIWDSLVMLLKGKEMVADAQGDGGNKPSP